MKLIYIAGPYRNNLGEWHIEQNIRNAEKAALFVWQHGGVALCPHKNTAFFGGAPGCPDEIWLKGDLELLERCDAIWAIDGYTDSKGAVEEVNFARIEMIPILYCHQDVINFLNENNPAK